MTEENKSVKEKYKKQLEEALGDLKTPGKRKKQIPNILTASRLLSPLLIIPAAITGNTALAAGAALGFGLTDLVDGKLADKLDARSELGADLDAFTDKIFAGTLLIGGAIFNPFLLANIALELMIAGINLKQKFSGKEPKSTQVGRVKTWFLFGLGGLGIIAPALNLAPALLPGLALATAAMQGATIVSYIKKYDETSQLKQPDNLQEQYESEMLESREEIEPVEKELVKTYEGSNQTNEITPELDAALDAMVEKMAQAEAQVSQPQQSTLKNVSNGDKVLVKSPTK